MLPRDFLRSQLEIAYAFPDLWVIFVFSLFGGPTPSGAHVLDHSW